MRSLIGRLAVAALFCLCAVPALADGPLEVRLASPAGVNPTVVTDRDNSGTYRVVRVTDSVYKLVNFDANLDVVFSTSSQVQAPTIIVTLGGTNGPDPMPTVKLTVVASGAGDTRSERSVDLRPGDSVPCPGATEVIITVGR